MNATQKYRIYGRFDGEHLHRMKYSFNPSAHFDFSNYSGNGETRIMDIECSDKTGTNDYVDVTITCDTEEACEREISGQLSDGIFENMRYGEVIKLVEPLAKLYWIETNAGNIVAISRGKACAAVTDYDLKDDVYFQEVVKTADRETKRGYAIEFLLLIAEGGDGVEGTITNWSNDYWVTADGDIETELTIADVLKSGDVLAAVEF